MSPEPLLGGPTRVDYAGAACKMRGKHERNHKFVVALPRAQAFDRRRQFGRGTTRNHPEPLRNHPGSMLDTSWIHIDAALALWQEFATGSWISMVHTCP